MKAFDQDPRYEYLVDFQRQLTQASVEKPAVMRRHDLLAREFDRWLAEDSLTGDAQYQADEGADPPIA